MAGCRSAVRALARHAQRSGLLGAQHEPAVVPAAAAAGAAARGLSTSGSAQQKLHSKEGKVLHPDLLNENFRKTQYAVRGELYLRAEELRQAGKEITFTNGAVGTCGWGLRGG